AYHSSIQGALHKLNIPLIEDLSPDLQKQAIRQLFPKDVLIQLIDFIEKDGGMRFLEKAIEATLQKWNLINKQPRLQTLQDLNKLKPITCPEVRTALKLAAKEPGSPLGFIK